jgi:hypothetical protein
MTYPCCSSRTQLRRCCGLLTLALTLFLAQAYGIPASTKGTPTSNSPNNLSAAAGRLSSVHAFRQARASRSGNKQQNQKQGVTSATKNRASLTAARHRAAPTAAPAATPSAAPAAPATPAGDRDATPKVTAHVLARESRRAATAPKCPKGHYLDGEACVDCKDYVSDQYCGKDCRPPKDCRKHHSSCFLIAEWDVYKAVKQTSAAASAPMAVNCCTGHRSSGSSSSSSRQRAAAAGAVPCSPSGNQHFCSCKLCKQQQQQSQMSAYIYPAQLLHHAATLGQHGCSTSQKTQYPPYSSN